MGVAVLPPQDYFRNHLCHRQEFQFPVNTKPRRNPNPNNRSSRRRRNSPPPSPPSGGPATKAQRAKSPPAVMGQVRILKRGEDLSPSPSSPSPSPPPVQQIGGPGPVPDGFYAGSAFVTSPPPSELPLPAFFTGRRNCGLNQEIASELRKVLKLT